MTRPTIHPESRTVSNSAIAPKQEIRTNHDIAGCEAEHLDKHHQPRCRIPSPASMDLSFESRVSPQIVSVRSCSNLRRRMPPDRSHKERRQKHPDRRCEAEHARSKLLHIDSPKLRGEVRPCRPPARTCPSRSLGASSTKRNNSLSVYASPSVPVTSDTVWMTRPRAPRRT